MMKQVLNVVAWTITPLLIAAVFCGPASAQLGPTFSVDFQGPTAGAAPGPFLGVPDGFGIGPIDEGSILTTALPGPPGPNLPLPGPLPPPGIMVGAIAGAPGSVPGGLGLVAGLPFGGVEVDALSYGRDFGPRNIDPLFQVVYFSVDEFAAGIPGTPAPPAVWTEGILGAAEAAADVFRFLGPNIPFPPGPIGNTAVIDGDGLLPFGGPGLGLVEPNPPTPLSLLMDPGDNLDAVDVNTRLQDVVGPIYFSLDANWPDPLEVPPGAGPPPNTATAVGNGFFSGDVLVTFAGGLPALYAPAPALGLDMVGGPDSDDLDALALLDNGDGIVALGPPGSGLDEILFSVRRGSAVIGVPDSALGIPIEEGDILTVPITGGPPVPAIWIAAEALGLATVRSGLGTPWGIPNPAWNNQDVWGDDLDALDVVPEPAASILFAISVGFLISVGRRRRQ